MPAQEFMLIGRGGYTCTVGMRTKSKQELNQKSRKQLRSKLHDYRSTGAYFVTICANKGLCLFGDVQDGIVVLNDAGAMIKREWSDIAIRFPLVGLDSFVVMPNHFHTIVTLEMDLIDGRWLRLRQTVNPHLSRVIGSFKSTTTIRYSQGVRLNHWPSFDGRLWQRSYFERVIRSDAELNRIRHYIECNPLNWHIDRENPFYVGTDDFDKWMDALMKRVQEKK